MIEQKLLLLGLLRDSPQHGYEIKKKIKEILAVFAGVDVKSIYYPLRILEKEGLVEKKVKKSGRRPERFVYQLTPEGQKQFQQLLAKSLLDLKRPQFNLDLSLYFLHYLPPAEARRRLRARVSVLNKLTDGLKSMIVSLKEKSPLSLVYILEHDLQMAESETRFISNLIKTI